MNNRRVSILIVDDHETTRRALALLISSFLPGEHTCSTVATAEEALKLFESSSFDLALVDVMLPGASGLDLCSLIRSEYPNTVVILVSGITAVQYLRGHQQGGCFEYVDKSANVQELKDSIRRALEYQETLMADQYYLKSL